MIAYNVFVVEVLEDVPVTGVSRVAKPTRPPRPADTDTSATICLRSRSVMRSKLSSLRAKIYHSRKVRRSWIPRGLSMTPTHDTICFPPDLANDSKGAVTYNVKRLVELKRRCHGGRVEVGKVEVGMVEMKARRSRLAVYSNTSAQTGALARPFVM